MKDTGPAMVKLHILTFLGPLLFSLIFFACAPAGQQPSDIDGDVTLHCDASQCFIEGQCIDAGTDSDDHDCLYCNPDLNPEGWSRYQSYDRHICRESLGECDPAETCNGTSDDCPRDKHAADGMPCGTHAPCHPMAYCEMGECVAISEPLPCPDNMRCDEESNECVCMDNFIGEDCSRCATGFTGENCDQCAPHFTGENCDQCTGGYEGDYCHHCNDHYTGENCDQCREGYSGEHCEICAEEYYLSYDETCKPCVDCGEHGTSTCGGNDKGECICDPGWGSYNCSHCAINYTGDNCDQCAEGYTGTDCGECSDGYYRSVDAVQCLLCSGCGDHGEIICEDRQYPYCVCDTGWSGYECDRCATNYSGDNCDQCAEGYTGTDCSECSEGFHHPEDSDECAKCPDCGEHGDAYCEDGERARCYCDNGWAGITCDYCGRFFTGENCDQCVEFRTGEDCRDCETNRTGRDCNYCIAGFAGDACDRCVENYTGDNCDQCAPGYEGPYCMPSFGCVHGSMDGIRCECEAGWFGSRCDRNTLTLPGCVPTGGICYRDVECCGEAHCASSSYGEPKTCIPGGPKRLLHGTLYGVSPCGNYVILEYLDMGYHPALVFLDITDLSPQHVINIPTRVSNWDVNLAEDLLLLGHSPSPTVLKKLSTGGTIALMNTSTSVSEMSSTGRFLLPRMDYYTGEESPAWYNMYSGEYVYLPGNTDIPDSPGGQYCISYYYRAHDLLFNPDDTRFVHANILMLVDSIDDPEQCECHDFLRVAGVQLSLTDTGDLEEQIIPGGWPTYRDMIYNRNGGMFAVMTTADEIILFDTNGDIVIRYPGTKAAFGPDGEIAILSNDGRISMHTPGEESPYLQFTAAEPYPSLDIALSPDGTLLAVKRSGGIAVFNAHNGQELVFRPWD